MNVYFHEIRSYFKTTLIWTVSLVLVLILFMSIYPSFSKDVASTKQSIETLPIAIRDALNISLDNFFTIFGFFSYILNFIVLAGSIQAMNLGISLLAKEQINKTDDFILSKPISRSSVLFNKLLASLTIIIFTNIIFIITAFLTAINVSNIDFNKYVFLLLSLTLFFIQLIFVAFGMLCSALLNKIKSIISVSIPFVLFFYIVGTLGDIFNSDYIRYVNPFKFYDTNFIISNHAYEIKYFIINLILIILMITISFWLFMKKDIKSYT